MVGYRTCHDCGSTSRQTGMAAPRKPRSRIDLCADCAAERELRAMPREQVPQRRAELTELYRQGAYRGLPRARPLPLFRGRG